MSSTIVSLLSKLSYLNTSLIFETTKGGFVLDILPDGKYCVEFDYPVQRRILSNVEQFIDSETITRVMLLNHETDDETIVYPSQIKTV